MTSDARPVVVGVDGSEDAGRALGWAAEEAARRGVALRLVMAQQITMPVSEMGWALGLDEMLRDGAESVLDETVARLREEHPGVDVTTQVVVGSPSSVLVDASPEAGLLVVGTRGAGGFPGLLLGSVAGAVASHARCPVVVVPDRWSGDSSGPVVVGVDGSAESARAAELALAQAEAWGRGVLAVHSWHLAFRGGVVPTEEGSEAMRELRAELDGVLERSLHAAQEAHPGVAVERRPVRGTSVEVLTEASRGASLVVVGSRGRGGFRGMLLGSTSRQLLQSSLAPVAVVRG